MVHGTHNALDDERNERIKIYVNGEFFSEMKLRFPFSIVVTWLAMGFGKL